MRSQLAIGLFAMLVAGMVSSAGAQTGGANCLSPQIEGPDGFCYPTIEMEGKLGEIISVTGCEYISGMSCRITYNGKASLPSKILFTEYDASNVKAGPPTRLLYAPLEPGKSVLAMFRIRMGSPSRVVLEGVWKQSSTSSE